MKQIVIFLLFVIFPVVMAGQTNSVISDLEKRRNSLLNQIRESESMISTAGKDIKGQLTNLTALSGLIEDRKRYILHVNNDVRALTREMTRLEVQLIQLQGDLKDKKKKYEASVQYLRRNKTIEEKLMFIFSARNLTQTYRRMRYVNEYATYQRLQGEEILTKQQEITGKKEEIEQSRQEKQRLLQEREEEANRLEGEQQQMRKLVKTLQSKQKGLQDEVNRKRKEASQLNARIDKLIAEEIERTRKEAEAEAKKEAEEERRVALEKGEKVPERTTVKPTPVGSFVMKKADRELSGNFLNNQGKLPMPVTGPYSIVSRFGQYSVEGLKNVRLDNKGIDIQAQPGAQARAIFNGEVSTVFQFQGNGLFNVLIRHGNYISVYCNLSSAVVKKGDTIKTNQPIGEIFSDKTDNNRTILHFQLRKERQQLNPENWLDK